MNHKELIKKNWRELTRNDPYWKHLLYYVLSRDYLFVVLSFEIFILSSYNYFHSRGILASYSSIIFMFALMYCIYGSKLFAEASGKTGAANKLEKYIKLVTWFVFFAIFNLLFIYQK